MTWGKQDQWEAELFRSVISPMRRVAAQLHRQGLRTNLDLPRGRSVLVGMTVLLPNSDDLGPNFLVQRDSDGWSVHRLTFQLEGEQFLQQTPQAESFERLPDEAWFELQLRAFVQGELQKGYLQAT